MNFLGNFFRKNKPKKSKYLPKKKEALEISFVKKFTSNGGKFLYCENEEELNLSFQNILFENQITSSDLFSNETSISEYFQIKNENFNSISLVMSCECLIADQGCIMVSDRQILNKKLNQLPKILIVVAKTSDFRNDVSEAMSSIRNKYGKPIPLNITNIHPTSSEKKSNFVSYKRISKELYLLLRDFNK